MSSVRDEIRNAKRIVIKVGTSTLTHETGKLNLSRIENLVKTISDTKNKGLEVVLVSSGAIAVGLGRLGKSERPKDIGTKQAAAAVGQCELMHIYSKLFLENGYTVGQILLTRDVVENDERCKNVVNTFNNLIKHDVIPIVNENDSVSIEEIEFGDNDTLSAIVAKLVEADLLILLSDIDGLFNADPRVSPDAKLIPEVFKIDDSIICMAGGAGTSNGTGGMVTKLSAAEIATASGIHMVLANGADPKIIYDILEGKQVGTLFASEKLKRPLREIPLGTSVLKTLKVKIRDNVAKEK